MKYLSPVGTADERASGKFPPGAWFDANPFGRLYAAPSGNAYHTGSDLNLNSPRWDEDAHKPVYAIADGVVTCAKEFAVWGNIIVTQHGTIYARYAHVEQMRVGVGQTVVQGEQIAQVGNANGIQPYHLHFDISPTDILYFKPNHWPKLNRDELLAYYIDPINFLRSQTVPEIPSMGLTIQRLKNISGTAVKVRTFPEVDNVKAPQLTQVAANGVVETRAELGRVTSGNYEWAYVIANDKGGWTAVKDIAANKEWFTPFL